MPKTPQYIIDRWKASKDWNEKRLNEVQYGLKQAESWIESREKEIALKEQNLQAEIKKELDQYKKTMGLTDQDAIEEVDIDNQDLQKKWKKAREEIKDLKKELIKWRKNKQETEIDKTFFEGRQQELKNDEQSEYAYNDARLPDGGERNEKDKEYLRNRYDMVRRGTDEYSFSTFREINRLSLRDTYYYEAKKLNNLKWGSSLWKDGLGELNRRIEENKAQRPQTEKTESDLKTLEEKKSLRQAEIRNKERKVHDAYRDYQVMQALTRHLGAPASINGTNTKEGRENDEKAIEKAAEVVKNIKKARKNARVALKKSEELLAKTLGKYKDEDTIKKVLSDPLDSNDPKQQLALEQAALEKAIKENEAKLEKDPLNVEYNERALAYQRVQNSLSLYRARNEVVDRDLLVKDARGMLSPKSPQEIIAAGNQIKHLKYAHQERENNLNAQEEQINKLAKRQKREQAFQAKQKQEHAKLDKLKAQTPVAEKQEREDQERRVKDATKEWVESKKKIEQTQRELEGLRKSDKFLQSIIETSKDAGTLASVTKQLKGYRTLEAARNKARKALNKAEIASASKSIDLIQTPAEIKYHGLTQAINKLKEEIALPQKTDVPGAVLPGVAKKNQKLEELEKERQQVEQSLNYNANALERKSLGRKLRERQKDYGHINTIMENFQNATPNARSNYPVKADLENFEAARDAREDIRKQLDKAVGARIERIRDIGGDWGEKGERQRNDRAKIDSDIKRLEEDDKTYQDFINQAMNPEPKDPNDNRNLSARLKDLKQGMKDLKKARKERDKVIELQVATNNINKKTDCESDQKVYDALMKGSIKQHPPQIDGHLESLREPKWIGRGDKGILDIRDKLREEVESTKKALDEAIKRRDKKKLSAKQGDPELKKLEMAVENAQQKHTNAEKDYVAAQVMIKKANIPNDLVGLQQDMQALNASRVKREVAAGKWNDIKEKTENNIKKYRDKGKEIAEKIKNAEALIPEGKKLQAGNMKEILELRKALKALSPKDPKNASLITELKEKLKKSEKRKEGLVMETKELETFVNEKKKELAANDLKLKKYESAKTQHEQAIEAPQIALDKLHTTFKKPPVVGEKVAAAAKTDTDMAPMDVVKDDKEKKQASATSSTSSKQNSEDPETALKQRAASSQPYSQPYPYKVIVPPKVAPDPQPLVTPAPKPVTPVIAVPMGGPAVAQPLQTAQPAAAQLSPQQQLQEKQRKTDEGVQQTIATLKTGVITGSGVAADIVKTQQSAGGPPSTLVAGLAQKGVFVKNLQKLGSPQPSTSSHTPSTAAVRTDLPQPPASQAPKLPNLASNTLPQSLAAAKQAAADQAADGPSPSKTGATNQVMTPAADLAATKAVDQQHAKEQEALAKDQKKQKAEAAAQAAQAGIEQPTAGSSSSHKLTPGPK